MLSRTAEICMAGVEDAGERLAAAPDIESFERAGRALQGIGRSLRQTLALKQRFDREQVIVEQARRRMADLAVEDAERAHRGAVTRRLTDVQRHFERTLWDEYEDDEAQERFEIMDAELCDLMEEEAFVDTPVETLIARLSAAVEAASLAAAAEVHAAPAPPVVTPADEPREQRPPAALSPPAQPAPRADPPVVDVTPPGPPDPPPEAPPDPPPEPYVPPWERLAAGHSLGGGTGW